VSGFFEHGYEPSGPIRRRRRKRKKERKKTLDRVSDCQILKKVSAPWNWFVVFICDNVTLFFFFFFLRTDKVKETKC
jgi:hypothetical protein